MVEHRARPPQRTRLVGLGIAAVAVIALAVLLLQGRGAPPVGLTPAQVSAAAPPARLTATPRALRTHRRDRALAHPKRRRHGTTLGVARAPHSLLGTVGVGVSLRAPTSAAPRTARGQASALCIAQGLCTG